MRWAYNTKREMGLYVSMDLFVNKYGSYQKLIQLHNIQLQSLMLTTMCINTRQKLSTLIRICSTLRLLNIHVQQKVFLAKIINTMMRTLRHKLLHTQLFNHLIRCYLSHEIAI